ncbi:SymE family type I addiction module toxin [Stenotrophomonas nitritireducens]|uniref:SymE family type I addiction module toxin n=1 Tax=Stenotrophomonas nitritireducens TaxID=83617 RepID=UPI003CCDA73A
MIRRYVRHGDDCPGGQCQHADDEADAVVKEHGAGFLQEGFDTLPACGERTHRTPCCDSHLASRHTNTVGEKTGRLIGTAKPVCGRVVLAGEQGRRFRTPSLYIRLRGHWLRHAGFIAGQKASMHIEDGCITIVPSPES